MRTSPCTWIVEHCERAQANGFRVAGFTDQHHFLPASSLNWQGVHRTARGRLGQSPLPDSPRQNANATLLHPEMLGRAFQVLALEKNIHHGAPQLAGFKFARELALR